MQSTLLEHDSSLVSETSCQDCHMSRVTNASGHRHASHDFRVVGLVSRLRESVRVTVEREGRVGIRYHIEAGRVGHSVPTGDLFRRL